MTHPKDSWVEGVEAPDANPPIDCAVLQAHLKQLAAQYHSVLALR